MLKKICSVKRSNFGRDFYVNEKLIHKNVLCLFPSSRNRVKTEPDGRVGRSAVASHTDDFRVVGFIQVVPTLIDSNCNLQ